MIVKSAHFVKPTPLKALKLSFQYFVSVLHVLEMCTSLVAIFFYIKSIFGLLSTYLVSIVIHFCRARLIFDFDWNSSLSLPIFNFTCSSFGQIRV